MWPSVEMKFRWVPGCDRDPAIDMKKGRHSKECSTLFFNRKLIRMKRKVGRGKRIRTSGPCLPKTVLYQAELFPDRCRSRFLGGPVRQECAYRGGFPGWQAGNDAFFKIITKAPHRES